MLTTDQITKLENLRNRNTLYEIAIVAPNGETFLVAYADRSGRRLRSAVTNRAERIVTTIGNRAAEVVKSTKESMTLTGGWVVKFTGRTQREAVMHGELTKMAVTQ